MFRTILLCAEAAAPAETLATRARGLTALGATSAVLAHVRETDAREGSLRTTGNSPETLRAQAEALTRAGLPASPSPERVASPEGLRDLADRRGAQAVAAALTSDDGPAALLASRNAGRTAHLLGRPLVVLGLGGAAPGRAGLLDHVLLPADFSVSAGCASACLERVARQGARLVTLLHVHDLRLDGQRRDGCRANGFGRIDLDWVDSLKERLLRAGVEEVRFEVSAGDGLQAVAHPSEAYTLVVLSGHCNDEVLAVYREAAARRLPTSAPAPAFMLPAGACSAT